MEAENDPEVEYYTSERTKGRPFSDAVRVGRMLYLSGQIGLVERGQLAPGGIVGETRQALENIKATLEQYGSSLEHVVKATVMLADINEWAEMNRVYVTYFPHHLPARSALGVNGLVIGARVEIECVAVIK
jgi:reactive intermediate/imine deaminase